MTEQLVGDGNINVSTVAASYKGKVDVTIITIPDDEYLAVLQRFSDRHAVRGRNIDEVTSVGTGAGVATVAVYRCPGQANSVAQTLATNLLDGLARRSLLVVGIAAGVPGTQYTLGDVIFGTRGVDLSVIPAIEGRHQSTTRMAGICWRNACRAVRWCG